MSLPPMPSFTKAGQLARSKAPQAAPPPASPVQTPSSALPPMPKSVPSRGAPPANSARPAPVAAPAGAPPLKSQTSMYDLAKREHAKIIKTLSQMGFPETFAQKAAGAIDPTHPNALELCFEWIERHIAKQKKKIAEQEKKMAMAESKSRDPPPPMPSHMPPPPSMPPRAESVESDNSSAPLAPPNPQGQSSVGRDRSESQHSQLSQRSDTADIALNQALRDDDDEKWLVDDADMRGDVNAAEELFGAPEEAGDDWEIPNDDDDDDDDIPWVDDIEDEKFLAEIASMGFTREEAKSALKAVQDFDTSAAVVYILSQRLKKAQEEEEEFDDDEPAPAYDDGIEQQFEAFNASQALPPMPTQQTDQAPRTDRTESVPPPPPPAWPSDGLDEKHGDGDTLLPPQTSSEADGDDNTTGGMEEPALPPLPPSYHAAHQRQVSNGGLPPATQRQRSRKTSSAAHAKAHMSPEERQDEKKRRADKRKAAKAAYVTALIGGVPQNAPPKAAKLLGAAMGAANFVTTKRTDIQRRMSSSTSKPSTASRSGGFDAKSVLQGAKADMNKPSGQKVSGDVLGILLGGGGSKKSGTTLVKSSSTPTMTKNQTTKVEPVKKRGSMMDLFRGSKQDTEKAPLAKSPSTVSVDSRNSDISPLPSPKMPPLPSSASPKLEAMSDASSTPIVKNDVQSEMRKAEKRAATRRKVVEELVETEQKYVADLETIDRIYYTPLSQERILSPEDLTTVFSNLHAIIKLNKQFLADLQERVYSKGGGKSNAAAGTSEAITAAGLPADVGHAKRDRYDVGDLLCSYGPFFKLYINYVNNHAQAQQFVSDVKKGKVPGHSSRSALSFRKGGFEALKTLMEAAKQSSECQGQSLESFLMMPVQRIPRYKLLIEEIMKNTSEEESGSDLSLLKVSLAQMKTTASAINEAVRHMEQAQKVLEVQNLFVPNIKLIKTGRIFVKKGKCTLEAVDIHDQKRQRNTRMKLRMFLFNDLLLFAEKKAADKYQAKLAIPVDRRLRVDTATEATAIPKSAPNKAKALLGDMSAAKKVMPKRMENSKAAKVMGGSSVAKDQADDDEDHSASGHVLMIMALRDTFMAYFASAADKIEWLTAIRDAVAARKEMEKHLKASNRAYRKCHVCDTEMSLMQRRQCGACLKVVHDMCSRNRMVLPEDRAKVRTTEDEKTHSKRVCNKCLPAVRREVAAARSTAPKPAKPKEVATNVFTI